MHASIGAHQTPQVGDATLPVRDADSGSADKWNKRAFRTSDNGETVKSRGEVGKPGESPSPRLNNVPGIHT